MFSQYFQNINYVYGVEMVLILAIAGYLAFILNALGLLKKKG